VREKKRGIGAAWAPNAIRLYENSKFELLRDIAPVADPKPVAFGAMAALRWPHHPARGSP
jgi:hypothetical protein